MSLLPCPGGAFAAAAVVAEVVAGAGSVAEGAEGALETVDTGVLAAPDEPPACAVCDLRAEASTEGALDGA